MNKQQTNQWRIQRRFRGLARNPLRAPVFKYPMEMKYFGLNEGYLRKM